MIPLTKIKQLKKSGSSNIQSFIEKKATQSVYIFSGQWAAYWRQNCNGYTYNKADAGIYTFSDALKNTYHCGQEKMIFYENVQL